MGAPLCLLDTGVGGRRRDVEISIISVYELISGFGFCVDGAFIKQTERRNAVRFGNATTSTSADADFDRVLQIRWQKHLDRAPPEIALTKGWKSHYWRSWLDGLDLYDDFDVGFEVAVADDDDDDIADDHFIGEIIEGFNVGDLCGLCEDPAGDDAHLPIPNSESGTGLPPPADDDRHVGPALYHQEQQGGPTQSKLECKSVRFGDENCTERSTLGDATPPSRWRCDHNPVAGHISAFPDNMLQTARRNFAKFFTLDVDEVDERRIEKA